jgi:CubicO group peptidase (beta-lactamase class C family)
MRPPLAVVFAVTTLVHSPGPGLELRVDLEQRVDAAVVRVKDQIPGLSVAVVVDNRVAYAKGVGTISLGTPKPALADTQYRLASVTKAITAVGVLKLVEQGRVDLDRPAKNYCPALSPLDGAPTVREFLLHQSGMRHTSDPEDETITGAVPRLASSLSNIVREPLRFRPGRKTLYTSWGYTALGCVIETVSGESYAQFITRNVLTPGSMQRTTFDEPTYAAPNFSPGFRMQAAPFSRRSSLTRDSRCRRAERSRPSTTWLDCDRAFRTPAGAGALLAGDALDATGSRRPTSVVHRRVDDRPSRPRDAWLQLQRIDGRHDRCAGDTSRAADRGRPACES